MSQNQWATFSGQQLASAYAQEADALGAIAMSPGFGNLISHYKDYDSYLDALNADSNHKKSVELLLKNNGVIDTAVPTKELAQLFCLAQIAACCELFKGSKIDAMQMNRDGMRALIEQGTETLRNIPEITLITPPDQYSESQRSLLNGINIIQNVDTIRVMQVLKLLGLINEAASKTQQLSLGVGNGYRDLYGIHQSPKITAQQDGSRVRFLFETEERQASHTVLIDNDPVYASHFETLNSEEGPRVLALNTDADQALQTLAERQKTGGIALRNLVLGLRIDHRMIPNSASFLQSIAGVTDMEADLVMTIGAGNNLAEFEGRLKCLDELFETLIASGHKPVRVLLHGKGSSAEQRSRPNFGQLAYTSYQILYCKLKRDLLS